MATVIEGLNDGICTLKSEIIYHHMISLWNWIYRLQFILSWTFSNCECCYKMWFQYTFNKSISL